jgi:hypothetical protein
MSSSSVRMSGGKPTEDVEVLTNFDEGLGMFFLLLIYSLG